ncbi:MAG: hypothetical protein ACD_9C00339G0001, partial [uncultured bacterium]
MLHRLFILVVKRFGVIMEQKGEYMKRRVVVLCGSDSDFAQISSGLAILRVAEA